MKDYAATNNTGDGVWSPSSHLTTRIIGSKFNDKNTDNTSPTSLGGFSQHDAALRRKQYAIQGRTEAGRVFADPAFVCVSIRGHAFYPVRDHAEPAACDIVREKMLPQQDHQLSQSTVLLDQFPFLSKSGRLALFLSYCKRCVSYSLYGNMSIVSIDRRVPFASWRTNSPISLLQELRSI